MTRPEGYTYSSEIDPSLYQPIPVAAGQVPDWKSIEIKEPEFVEPLVPLGSLSDTAGQIITSSVYFGEHSSSPYIHDNNRLEGRLLTLFARSSVAARLLAAEQLLPAGHHLIVFDAYRPLEVQSSLYRFYKEQLKTQQPNLDDSVLDEMTQQYVSVPSTDETRPSPHNTGGSVDLAIVKLTLEQEEELNRLQNQLSEHNLTTPRRAALEMRKSALIRHHARMLSFGTPFDHGGEKAGLAYYEQELAKGTTLSEDEVEARNNRRLLYNVMTGAGFQPYFAEWWHFNAPESQMGAATAGFEYATFGMAPFSEDNIAHESLRTRIYKEAVRLQEQLMSCAGKVSTQSALASAILETLPTTGEPRLVFSWPTEIIAPAER